MAGNEIAAGRTYLDTSDGLWEYAQRNGALYDKQRREWYVVGEVPIDLLNLVPKTSRVKAPPVVAPSCPVCGFHTKLIHGKYGPFFACSQYFKTKCPGVVDHDRYLNSINQPLPKSVETILNSESLVQSASVEPVAETLTLAPNCPKCGLPTTLVKRKHSQFFGCSQHWISGCRGSVDYDKNLKGIDPSLAKPVESILNPESLKQIDKAVLKEKVSSVELEPDLKLAIRELERLCQSAFGTRAELELWINSPKVALSGKTPLQSMLTIEGCNKVTRLIQTRWD